MVLRGDQWTETSFLLSCFNDVTPCEQRQRPLRNPTCEASGTGDTEAVRWDQRMAFPML